MSNPGNVAGGHKATINNPNVSDEAKQHSKEVLEKEFDTTVDIPKTAHLTEDGKDPSHVAAGLKAAIHNPNVSDEAKESAEKRLAEFK